MKKYFFFLLFFSYLFPQQPFKFAHISDTHVGSSTGAEDLRRTVRDLNSMNDVSFAIITGDITEYGSDAQLRLAKQIFDSLKIPWYVVPGNHDMKWSESGGTSFAKIFGNENFVFDFAGFKFIGMHQGPRMRMGDGYWAPEDLKWFDSLTQSIPNKHQPIFLATHYPADSGIANWFEMTERLKKYNTQALLNGHWHRNYFQLFDGIPSVLSRSNLRANDQVGGYNIVAIQNDSMIYTTRIPGIETKKPWCVVQLGERQYATEKSISANSDNISPVHVLWKSTYSVSMTSPPTVWKDYLASAYSDGKVLIRSLKTGLYIFDVSTGYGIFSSPVLDDTHLVITSSDSSVYCYAIKTKKVLWKYKTRASIVATPAIKNGTVFFGSSDSTFRAIDLKSGKLRWQFDSLQGFVESKATFVNGKIFFGAWDEHLYCLDEKKGTLLWKWKGDKRGVLLSPAVCEPVYANGKIFIVAPDRFMTAIDIETGKQIWRTNRFQVRETIGMSEDGKRVYVRTMNDSLYALSTTAVQPEIIWSLNAGFGYDINSAQIRGKDGVIFYATKNGVLLVIDGKSGRLLQTLKEGMVIAHTPIPLSKSNVIFSNICGTIMEVKLNQE